MIDKIFKAVDKVDRLSSRIDKIDRTTDRVEGQAKKISKSGSNKMKWIILAVIVLIAIAYIIWGN